MLREALGRLQATSIVTNIRVTKGKKHRQFSWIESWTDHEDPETQQSKGMSLTLSDWFYEGILMDGGLLAIEPAYISRSQAAANAGFTASRASTPAGQGRGASPFRCRPCSRNQARKAPIAASSSRCWPSSGATTCPASILPWSWRARSLACA